MTQSAYQEGIGTRWMCPDHGKQTWAVSSVMDSDRGIWYCGECRAQLVPRVEAEPAWKQSLKIPEGYQVKFETKDYVPPGREEIYVKRHYQCPNHGLQKTAWIREDLVLACMKCGWVLELTEDRDLKTGIRQIEQGEKRDRERRGL